jgi:catechol 2,3-dioxygenase-like lactoylglutathione lyase family enzyme
MTLNIGWHDICLKTSNLEESKRFYQALGFTVTHDTDGWVHLSNGDLNISLMTFLGENWLNFRGANISGIKERLDELEIKAEGKVETYVEDGETGTHWQTRDPDGNTLYFDTTSHETSKAMEVNVLLANLERRLQVMGVTSKHFDAFKADLANQYSSDK